MFVLQVPIVDPRYHTNLKALRVEFWVDVRMKSYPKLEVLTEKSGELRSSNPQIEDLGKKIFVVLFHNQKQVTLNTYFVRITISIHFIILFAHIVRIQPTWQRVFLKQTI